MSKKRRKNRRRRKGCSCLGCIVTLLIVFVLFVGGLYGGSVFAWNKYVSPQVGGVTLNQTIAILIQTYKADEKKIVTNPYEEKDEDGFYTSLREALFLAPSVDIKDTFSAVVADLLAGNNTNNNEVVQAAFANEESVTGNETLDKFLEDLEFDFSRLEDYKDEYQTPQVLEVTDKQIAAFINSAIGLVLESESIKSQTESLSQYGLDLSKIASIPQVVIANADPLNPKTTSLTITIKVDVRTTVESALNSVMPQLKFLAKLLPKSLYATATVYPNDYNASSEIKINDFGNEHMSNLYKLIDGVLAFTNQDPSENSLTIESILKLANQKVIEALESVQSLVPISFVNTGSLEIKPIETLMGMLNITNITQTQFLCMLRDICLPTFDTIKTDLGYSEDTTRDSIQTALDSSVSMFVSEIETKYAIEHGFIDADNAFDTLTNISQDTSSFAEHINVKNLNFNDDIYVSYNHKVEVPYKALAKLVNDKIGDSLGENIQANVINMVYDIQTNSIGIIVEIDLHSAFGDGDSNSTQFKLISQLIPKNIYIKANINLDTTESTIQLNGLNDEQTQGHLNTLTSIASSLGLSLDSFDYSSLTSQLGVQLISALDEIEVQLGTKIIFEEEFALLPNIYEVMSGTILYSSEDEAQNLSAAQVYGVFKELHEIPDEYKLSNKSETISGFIGEVNEKYYINDENKLSIESEETILDQLTGLASTFNNAIKGAELAQAWSEATMTANEVEKNEIMLNSFSPIAKEGELANIFAQAINITADNLKNLTLDSVYIVDDSQIELILKAEFEASTSDNMDYSKLIPSFIIKVNLDISKISGEDKCCVITLNNMDPDGTLKDFSLLCSRLSSSAFNISEIENSCDTNIKTQLSSLFEKISLQLSPATSEEDAKAYIGSIFEAAYKNIKTAESTYTKIDLADTISGLHNEINVVGQNNIDEDLDKYNDTPSVEIDGTDLIIGATLSARNIGASILALGFDQISDNLNIPQEEIELYQVGLIDYTDQTYLLNYKQEFSSYFVEGLSIHNLACITMKIGAQNLGYNSTLLPSNLYLNAFINLDTGVLKILYNNLNTTQMQVLKSLSGDNADALDAQKSEQEMTSYLRDVVLFTVTYMTYDTSVKFGDVIDAQAGEVTNTLMDEKICGNYAIDYRKSILNL